MTARFSTLSTVCGLLLPTLFLGCGSAQKQRLEMRDKMAASSGLYCEFISGDVHNDVDVEMNLQMARRCEPTKPFSITNYKNSSENFGVIYCCSIKKDEKKAGANHLSPTPSTAATAGDELDLSDDPKSKIPPKTNPTTLNNPAAPAKADATKATAPAKAAKPAPSANSTTPATKPAASSPATSSASKPAASSAPSSASSPSSSASSPSSSAPSSSTSSAKPSNPAPQQNTAPKAPKKTPDLDADILGE